MTWLSKVLQNLGDYIVENWPALAIGFLLAFVPLGIGLSVQAKGQKKNRREADQRIEKQQRDFQKTIEPLKEGISQIVSEIAEIKQVTEQLRSSLPPVHQEQVKHALVKVETLQGTAAVLAANVEAAEAVKFKGSASAEITHPFTQFPDGEKPDQ